ncbi:MAG TPA: (Fe-S)-binding protein [Pirellulales bacterium]|jgi:L-lactate dehydrogenase complex protein LldE|nr:(Fe-S)-binding protein [Pirellulales bacterium]
MKISLMVTCLGDVFRPEGAKATVRLLRRLGHEIVFPESQTCCGQPFYNSGFPDLAREQARHTIRAFDDAETVVVPSGSCAAMVKLEYPRLLEGDPAWHERAVSLAGRTFELSDLLVNRLKVLDVGARFDGRVAYHYACHLRGLGLERESVALIEHVAGATYVPLRHQEQCCGFGGSFAVRYPQISTAMVNDKTKCIAETEADVLVSTDAGCLMNIGGRLHRQGIAIPAIHLAELLDGSRSSG